MYPRLVSWILHLIAEVFPSKEFWIMGLSINESVYSCLFFFLTGLHFFHLLVGLLLLLGPALCHFGINLPVHMVRGVKKTKIYVPENHFLRPTESRKNFLPVTSSARRIFGFLVLSGWDLHYNLGLVGWVRKVLHLVPYESAKAVLVCGFLGYELLQLEKTHKGRVAHWVTIGQQFVFGISQGSYLLVNRSSCEGFFLGLGAP